MCIICEFLDEDAEAIEAVGELVIKVSEAFLEAGRTLGIYPEELAEQLRSVKSNFGGKPAEFFFELVAQTVECVIVDRETGSVIEIKTVMVSKMVESLRELEMPSDKSLN